MRFPWWLLLQVIAVSSVWGASVHVSVSSGADSPTCGSSAAPCASMLGAITALGSAPVFSTILVEAGTYSGTGNTNLIFTFSNLALVAQGLVVIDGESSAQGWKIVGTNVTIAGFTFLTIYGFQPEGNQAGGLLLDGAAAEVNVLNCSFLNGIDFASAIRTDAISVNFTNCIITGNSGGAAVSIDGGTSTWTNCSFDGNSTPRAADGSAVHIASGASTWINCRFNGNSASGQTAAGAIAVSTGTSEFVSCSFDNNLSNGGYAGGAIILGGGTSTWTKCTFDDNNSPTLLVISAFSTWNQCNFTGGFATAPQTGGAAQFGGGTTTFNQCNFVRNSGIGGAIYSVSGLQTFVQCSFVNNIAITGGALMITNIASSSSNVLLDGCLIRQNSASSGGGIYAIGGSGVQIRNSQVMENSATQNGGGIYVEAGSTMQLTDCEVSGNYAKISGGGMYLLSCLQSSTFPKLFNNSAGMNISLPQTILKCIGSNGGAVYVGAPCAIANNSFTLNTAVKGGAIYVSSLGVSISQVLFSKNSAQNGGALFGSFGFSLQSSYFKNNTAVSSGGGLAIQGPGGLNASETSFEFNTAFIGGGLSLQSDTSTIINSSIAYNTGYDAGGGIGCNSVINLINVTGLQTNAVDVPANQGSAAVACLSKSCVIYTSDMPPLNSSCTYIPVPVMYVSNTGTNYVLCGTENNPCASINYAATQATSTPIVIQLVSGTTSGLNCATIGPFSRSIEIRGSAKMDSVLDCSSSVGPSIQLFSGETSETVWIHDFTILVGPQSSAFLFSASSPAIDRIVIATLSTILPVLTEPVIELVNSDATFQQLQIHGIASSSGSSSAVIDVHCTVSPCDHSVQISSSLFSNITGNVVLLTSNAASASLSNCTFRNNSAVGVSSSFFAAASVSCTTGCQLMISNCLFADNVGVLGGALGANNGVVTVNNSVMMNNRATQGGGAVTLVHGSVSIFATLISNNFAPNGGGISSSGSLLVFSCTLVENHASLVGGAVFVTAGQATLVRSIASGNTAATGGGLAVNGDELSLVQLVDTTLSNNTATTSGSAASVIGGSLFVANNSFIANHSSVSSGTIDISYGSFTCDKSSIQDNAVATGNGGALQAVNSVVVFSGCQLSRNSAFSGGAFACTQSSVSVSGGSIDQCSAEYAGVVYLIQSSLTTSSVSMQDNFASIAGGVVFAVESSVTLVTSSFSRGSSVNGGAIFAVLSSVSLSNIFFDSFSAFGNGGALDLTLTGVTAENTIFRNNIATIGGAMSLRTVSDDLSINNCTFSNNVARNEGGALSIDQSSIPAVISNSVWSNNTARQGSAISSNSPLVLNNCNFISNRGLQSDAGAIYVSPQVGEADVITSVDSSMFAWNTGGCFVQTGGILQIHNSSISDNTNDGSDGGAVALVGTSLQLLASNVTGNLAQQGGAIIATDLSAVIATDTIFSGNWAAISGGAIQVDSTSSLNVSGTSVFSGNAAKGGGGGACYAASGSAAAMVLASTCRLSNNVAIYGDDLATAESGSLVSENVTLNVVDAFNHIVTLYSAPRVFIVAENASTSIQGNSFTAVVNGTAAFTSGQFAVAATPGTIVRVSLVTGSLTPTFLSIQLGLCRSGTELANGSLPICIPCQPGFYKDLQGNHPCSACPVGSFSASSGAISIRNCTCTNGYGVSDSGECVPCAAGFYSSFVTAGCVPCDPGYVSVPTGSSVCEACIRGSTASDNGTQCDCNPGFGIVGYSGYLPLCQLCSGNLYKSVSGNSACLTCANSSASSPDGTACICNAGSFFNGTSCVPCAAGFYTTGSGSSTCSQCEGNTFVGYPGATVCTQCPANTTSTENKTSCECIAGYSPSALNQCRACPAGSAKLQAGDSACVACSFGQYSSSDGSSICQQIPPGAISNSDRTGYTSCAAFAQVDTNSTACLCLPGYTGDGVTSCTPCSPGTAKLALGDSACVACSFGQYSSGDGSSICQQIPPQAVSYNNRTGFDFCNQNAVTNVDNTQCVCLPGYTGDGINFCTPCAKGTANFEGGNASCVVCGAGLYASNDGSSVCSPVPEGAIPFPDRTGYSPCKPFAQPNGNITACLCQPGYTGDGSVGCSSCSQNTYKNEFGPGSCVVCPPGSFAGQIGATLCSPAPPNTVVLSNGTEFVTCPPEGVFCSTTQVVAQSGFFAVWHNNTVEALRCIPGACLLGDDVFTANPSPFECVNPSDAMNFGLVPSYCVGTNLCAGNRTGYMCGACSDGFAVSGSGSCLECPGVVPYRVFLQLMLNWAIVVIVHMLLTGSGGGVVKLLVEYAQLALLLAPDTEANVVLQLLNVHMPSLGGCSYPLDYFGLFVQRLVTPLIQFGQFGISFLVLSIAFRLFSGEYPDRARWLWTPIVSLLVSMYEPVTSAAFDLLHCTEEAGYMVMASAPAYDCTSARYTFYANIAYGVIACVTVLFPVALVVVLIYARHRFELPEIQQRLGGLYLEFRPNMRFWLVISLVRRTVLVALQQIPLAPLAAVLSVIVVYGFLIAHRWLHPLHESTGNRLQEISFTSLALIASGTAIVSLADQLPGFDEFSNGIQYFEAALALCTLLLMLVITVWHMRTTIVAAWNVLKAGYQLVDYRRRQWSQAPALPPASGELELKERLITDEDL